MEFEAIVVGSGMSGGWVAKELSERGLKTLVIERGRHVEHGPDYADFARPWERETRGRVNEDEIAEHYPIQSKVYAFDASTKHWWVRDSEHPYLTPEGRPFTWIRGYHLGGRSLMWWRQSYRWSEMDFEANAKDGHGVDWPIRYADMAPWYDHVESFAGISGAREGFEQLPDGVFQPPMELTCVESEIKRRLEDRFPSRSLTIGRCAHLTEPTEEQLALGRGPCQFRNICERGCSFGAYFSSLSATLPAAERTGNLTIVTDAICESVEYDPVSGRATGVRVIDTATRTGRFYSARVIFLCASTIPTAQILLNSRSESFPTGIANRSDMVGRNLMDHVSGMNAVARMPGFEDRHYSGRRPNGPYIPRYKNVTEPTDEFLRGYAFQIETYRAGWTRGTLEPGVGIELKEKLRYPGPWTVNLYGFGEMLPRPDNRVTLHSKQTDQWGIPLVLIDCTWGDNDKKIMEHANRDAREMLEAVGCVDVELSDEIADPGFAIHEMGTARMGRDPQTSVLNEFNQAHDVPNLFITDGSSMTSNACQNPSLTYMAMSARGAHYAAEFLREGKI